MGHSIDYLAIGHVSRDLTPQGDALGGSVTFSALTARALGWEPGVITSAPAADHPLLAPLRDIPTTVIPAQTFTTFENVYTPAGRVQTLRGQAARITPVTLPADLPTPAVVHIAPIADEVDLALVRAFPGAWVGVTAQGWLRGWDAAGRVHYKGWEHIADALPAIDALIISPEDVNGDESVFAELARRVTILIITRGARGCTVIAAGERVNIDAPHVVERDPTGAGDIFAGAFFTQMPDSPDPLIAARFATAVASASVEHRGLDAIPTPDTIRRAQAYASKETS